MSSFQDENIVDLLLQQHGHVPSTKLINNIFDMVSTHTLSLSLVVVVVILSNVGICIELNLSWIVLHLIAFVHCF
jgi:hypothetical protein